MEMNKRTIISSWFITLLLGIAFKESAAVLRDLLYRQGFEFNPLWIIRNLSLLYVFLLTSVRFYIGNILHLRRLESDQKMSRYVWLVDFIAISFESFIFILLGMTSAIQASPHLSFLHLLAFLSFIDVAWIVIQWLLGILRRKWRRQYLIPWPWAALNCVSGLYLAFVILVWPTYLYCHTQLLISAVWFTGAAAIDVLLVDHYELLK